MPAFFHHRTFLISDRHPDMEIRLPNFLLGGPAVGGGSAIYETNPFSLKKAPG
jgi:hypothetical protein